MHNIETFPMSVLFLGAPRLGFRRIVMTACSCFTCGRWARASGTVLLLNRLFCGIDINTMASSTADRHEGLTNPQVISLLTQPRPTDTENFSRSLAETRASVPPLADPAPCLLTILPPATQPQSGSAGEDHPYLLQLVNSRISHPLCRPVEPWRTTWDKTYNTSTHRFIRAPSTPNDARADTWAHADADEHTDLTKNASLLICPREGVSLTAFGTSRMIPSSGIFTIGGVVSLEHLSALREEGYDIDPADSINSHAESLKGVTKVIYGWAQFDGLSESDGLTRPLRMKTPSREPIPLVGEPWMAS